MLYCLIKYKDSEIKILYRISTQNKMCQGTYFKTKQWF